MDLLKNSILFINYMKAKAIVVLEILLYSTSHNVTEKIN